jgi:hypothetical protein
MQIRREGQQQSNNAHGLSILQYPQLEFDPPGGPLGTIELPVRDGAARAQNKYHVVVTGDCGLYGRWQTLVRLQREILFLGVSSVLPRV